MERAVSAWSGAVREGSRGTHGPRHGVPGSPADPASSRATSAATAAPSASPATDASRAKARRPSATASRKPSRSHIRMSGVRSAAASSLRQPSPGSTRHRRTRRQANTKVRSGGRTTRTKTSSARPRASPAPAMSPRREPGAAKLGTAPNRVEVGARALGCRGALGPGLRMPPRPPRGPGGASPGRWRTRPSIRRGPVAAPRSKLASPDPIRLHIDPASAPTRRARPDGRACSRRREPGGSCSTPRRDATRRHPIVPVRS